MNSCRDLWWCRNCGVPLLKRECGNCGYEGFKICSDLKPMFDEECSFLEREIGKELPAKSWQNGLWIRYKTIWFNGKKLLRLSATGKVTIINEYPYKYSSLKNNVTPEILYRANKPTLDELERKRSHLLRKLLNHIHRGGRLFLLVEGKTVLLFHI